MCNEHSMPSILKTFLYCKPNAKSEYPSSLKSSIAYSQTLRVKTICSTVDTYQTNCETMKQKLLEKKYNEENLNKLMDNVDLIKRNKFLQRKKLSKKTTPLLLTYNRAFQNILEIVKN